MATDVQMTLIENALDFLDEAVERLVQADNGDGQSLKYAILHLHSAVELLLKERLRREHWSLIFQDINKAKMDNLETGAFKSVTQSESIDRLKSICQISVVDHEKALNRLRDMRNKAEHYALVINVGEAKVLLVSTWDFVLDFEHNHLHLTGANRQHFDEIRDKIKEIQSFVDHKMEEIKKKEIGGVVYIDCFCGYERSLPLGDGNILRCELCYQKASKEEYYKYDETNFHVCVDCGFEAFVHDGKNKSDYDWICLSCGHTEKDENIVSCGRCGEPYIEHDPYDSIGLCENCFEYYRNTE